MLKPFVDHLCLDKAMIKKNEVSVIKLTLEYKTMSTIFDLFNELTPKKQAFPSMIELIKSEITQVERARS